MTKYNSSKYRVEPLMDYLGKDLDKLNYFLNNSFKVEVNSIPVECKYGDYEKLLKPTMNHLLKLVEYIGSKDCSSLSTKNKDRIELYFGNNRINKVEEAKKLIERKYDSLTQTSNRWYVFEGYTHPDIFIEGDDYIIICEGKWTESHITTSTTNLQYKNGEYRNQMIRHLQAALNYSNKKVIGFYLVDGNAKYLDDLAKESFAKQIDQETINIDDVERQKLLDSFYGFTTWQKVNELFKDIKFKSKKEIDIERELNS